MQIDALMLVEAATIHNGVANILGAGIDTFLVTPLSESENMTISRPNGEVVPVVGQPMRFTIFARVCESANHIGQDKNLMFRMINTDGKIVTELLSSFRISENPKRLRGWDITINIVVTLDIIPTDLGNHRIEVYHEGRILKSIHFQILVLQRVS